MRVDFARLVKVSLFDRNHVRFAILRYMLRNALRTKRHQSVLAKVGYIHSRVKVALSC